MIFTDYSQHIPKITASPVCTAIKMTSITSNYAFHFHRALNFRLCIFLNAPASGGLRPQTPWFAPPTPPGSAPVTKLASIVEPVTCDPDMVFQLCIVITKKWLFTFCQLQLKPSNICECFLFHRVLCALRWSGTLHCEYMMLYFCKNCKNCSNQLIFGTIILSKMNCHLFVNADAHISLLIIVLCNIFR